MSWSRTSRRIATWFVAAGLAAALGGCAAGPGGASPSATPVSSSLSSPLTSPVPPSAALDAPPDAMLAAEGGDPVAGQVGTYIWGNGGSDSPWLPGAPIAVGAGEPFTVSMDPETAIESWAAIYVPASADGPAGGLDLGAGAGSPAFAAPGAGSWTVDLEVVFAEGAGTAHYAWRLECSDDVRRIGESAAAPDPGRRRDFSGRSLAQPASDVSGGADRLRREDRNLGILGQHDAHDLLEDKKVDA